MTIKEVLVNAMGGIDEVRRKRLPLTKSSCFQAKKAQSDCVPNLNTFREMKGLGFQWHDTERGRMAERTRSSEKCSSNSEKVVPMGALGVPLTNLH